MKPFKILVTDDCIRFIHDDDLVKVFAKHGDVRTRRASHVEPGDPARGQDPTKWYADLAPSNGPVLGGFDERSAALAAEVEWINQNVLTVAATTE